MTTTTSNITAAEWLNVRDAVASKVGTAVTRGTQQQTKLNIAEALLRDGFIDIEAVRMAIAPPVSKVEVTSYADTAPVYEDTAFN